MLTTAPPAIKRRDPKLKAPGASQTQQQSQQDQCPCFEQTEFYYGNNAMAKASTAPGADQILCGHWPLEMPHKGIPGDLLLAALFMLLGRVLVSGFPSCPMDGLQLASTGMKKRKDVGAS